MSETDKRDTIDADAGGDMLEMLKQRERNLALALCVARPATVVAYDPTTQTASLTVDTLAVESRIVPGPPDPPQTLARVPVAWLGGMGGTAYQSIQLLPGDTGIVLCMDRALDQWRKLGVPCDPIDGRTHSLADAVFLPILRPDTAPITPPPSVAAHVIEGPLVHVGAGAVDFTIRGTALVSALSTISSVLTAVPAASDPATVITLANANKAAILAIIAAISSNLSTKAMVR